VHTLGMQVDGKILVGGDPFSIIAPPSDRIFRLEHGGSLDNSFVSGANSNVTSVALQADGKALAGGLFTILNQESRSLFGRLSTGAAAMQTLAIDWGRAGATVKWSRTQAGPAVHQVTFERSADGSNYFTLGMATRTNGNWELSGLQFPTGQSFYLRARGRTTGGLYNGSSGIIESVAQFWRLPPPFISGMQVLGGGVFQFSFTNTNVVAFSVLASTSLGAPLTIWENLGAPVPANNGLYQFTDPGATNHSHRFYQLRSP